MRHRCYLPLFLSLALFPSSSPPAQAQDARPDLGANAAMKYWQAFALMPTPDKDQEKLLWDGYKAPLDAAAAKLIGNSEMSLKYLNRGAKLQLCDWSLDYNDGIFLPLPHAYKSRTLSRLAALHARHEFEQGHWKAGLEDVTSLFKLARHVETDPIVIIQMVGYTIEAAAIETAASHLPELKSVLPEPASAVVDALPARPTIQQMLLKEKEVGPMWLIRAIRQAEQTKAGSWQDVWKQALAPAIEGSESDYQALVKSAGPAEGAIKKLEDLFPYYDELANLVALPWSEFDAKYAEFAKRTKSENVLAGFFIPAIDRVVAAERRSEAQMALFKAALAVVEGGPDKLKDIKDPFGDGPFAYRALDKGFELKSKLLFKGQPVMLAVGSGK
jgi:hypothetical protein